MDFCYPILAAGDFGGNSRNRRPKMGHPVLAVKNDLASAEQRAEQIPQRALRASET
jgi:hypothetical protein